MEAYKAKTVVAGLSGGVDSSVAAALLQDQGYNVIGVFIRAWQPDFLPCTWKEDRQSAMQVAASLHIPFHTADLSDEYKKYVFDHMVASYARGETPNPDVACNEFVKFGFFLKYAESLGAEYVATGHYAQINTTLGMPVLQAARDREKDQSYFLAHIQPDVLGRVLFPIGHLLKSEVRRKAKKRKLPTHNRKDSQGLCFVGHLDMKEFLKEAAPHKKGALLNEDGVVIGEHDGAVLYTIGERHGFSTHTQSASRTPLYIVRKSVSSNTLTVAPKQQGTVSLRLILRDVRWFVQPAGLQVNQFARFRYRQELQASMVEPTATGASVEIRECSDIPSIGQLLVIYQGDLVAGSGIIDTVIES